MARTKGTANLSGTIEALAGGPLDARSVVPTKADLTVGSNFPYPYIGLETYVTAENKKYRLVGDDPTVEANWEEVGSGGSSVPSGGTTGQALIKHSNTDGDVEWASVIPASAKGTASGVAELDSNGKVPASQLPSYVDDVVEGYYKAADDRFYEESTFTTLIPPESGKSWVDIAGNKSYRWSGSAYVRVDEGVQLGETSDTAYRGDRGKTAYDFSQAPYTSTPAMDGNGSAGSSNAWAKGDHVHPKDTTKADKVSGATSGHLAALNSSGNLTDSGKALSDLQAKLTAGEGITINSSTNTISADVNYLIGAYDIYDSTERVVGYYYGKPLYRKVLETTIPTCTTAGTPVTSSGISIGASVEIAMTKGFYKQNEYWLPIYQVASLLLDGTSSIRGTRIFVATNSQSTSTAKNKVFLQNNNPEANGVPVKIIVEYTKTTDTATTVSYGHENQYSTSEQIVGTWIDGKPIYQKTVQGTMPSSSSAGVVSDTTFSHNISNISKIVGMKYNVNNTNGFYLFDNTYTGSENNTFVYVRPNTSSITITNTMPVFNGQTIYVTLQYTKTAT